MKLPFVTRKRHEFVEQLFSHYKKKADRLEAERIHPRAVNGKFVGAGNTAIGNQIRGYYAEQQIRLTNQLYALLMEI